MNFDKEMAQSLKEALACACEAAKSAADGIKSAVDGMMPEQMQHIMEKAMEKAAENKEDVITLSPYDEPIEVAQKLILSAYEEEPSTIEKALGCTKPTLRAYYSPHELRQIAKHLLVYCDGAEGEEDDDV